MNMLKDETLWGCSSVGRAAGSQSVGREFDPPQLHHLSCNRKIIVIELNHRDIAQLGFSACFGLEDENNLKMLFSPQEAKFCY